MTPTQSAASLALAQVNLLLAEANQQANAHARYTESLRAIQKRADESKAEVDRLVQASAAEALAISARMTQLESDVQHFIQLNKEVGNG